MAWEVLLLILLALAHAAGGNYWMAGILSSQVLLLSKRARPVFSVAPAAFHEDRPWSAYAYLVSACNGFFC